MDFENNTPNPNTPAFAAGPLSVDLEPYLPEVEEHFCSDEEAMEFLRTLWNIMCAFVDLGWGVDSIHFAFPELAEAALSSSDQDIDGEFAKAAHAPESDNA